MGNSCQNTKLVSPGEIRWGGSGCQTSFVRLVVQNHSRFATAPLKSAVQPTVRTVKFVSTSIPVYRGNELVISRSSQLHSERDSSCERSSLRSTPDKLLQHTLSPAAIVPTIAKIAKTILPLCLIRIICPYYITCPMRSVLTFQRPRGPQTMRSPLKAEKPRSRTATAALSSTSYRSSPITYGRNEEYGRGAWRPRFRADPHRSRRRHRPTRRRG